MGPPVMCCTTADAPVTIWTDGRRTVLIYPDNTATVVPALHAPAACQKV